MKKGWLFLAVLVSLLFWAISSIRDSASVAFCGSETCRIHAHVVQGQVADPGIGAYFSNLFDTSSYPARWQCGLWTPFEGWLYIISNLVVFLAYFFIPVVLFFFLRKRDFEGFRRLIWLFAAFILLCGLTHLVDAVIFWNPVYRFNGLLLAMTGLVSVGTLFALVHSMPILMAFRSPVELESEIRAATEKAGELDHILKEVFSLARIGAWQLDLRTSKVVWSDSLYEIYEIEKGTPIDLNDSLRFYPGQEELISGTIQKAIEDQQPYELELYLTTVKGNKLWTKAVGTPQVENGQVVKIKGLVIDIDARKRMEMRQEEENRILEERVQERTLELVELNKDLESFTYSASHDLQAPARAIRGFATHLHDVLDGRLDATEKDHLFRIIRNSERMEILVDDLLEFSRLGRKQAAMDWISLTELVESVIEEEFRDSRKIIHFGELPTVSGDASLLRQVFVNLLSNAIKYSSKQEQPEIRITGNHDEQWACVTVSDNGVGFDMTKIDYLFGAFQRLHSSSEFKGSGLGLALCKRIVQLHKGTIEAHGEIGNGSSFTIKLPLQV
jgi:signal transduction histidine kinase